MKPIVELKNVPKECHGVPAIKGIDFDLVPFLTMPQHLYLRTTIPTVAELRR